MSDSEMSPASETSDVDRVVSGFCACMGKIGNDPHCPCEMRRLGLEPTEIWTPEAKEELKIALATIFKMESGADR